MKRILTIAIFLLLPATVFAQDPPKDEVPPAEGTPAEKPETPAEETPAPETPEEPKEEPKEEAESTPDSQPAKPADATQKTKAAPVPRTKYNTKRPKPMVDSAWNSDLSEFMRRYKWRLKIGGYIRAGYTSIQDDPGGNFGNNDGFGLANARLTLDGMMGKTAGFRFQIDGGVQRSTGANDPNAEVVVRARDMNLWWQPLRYARLTVGQFKAPFDAEAVASNTEIPFVHRSVGSRGVQNVEGVNRDGLSRDREAGVMLSSRFHFDDNPTKNEGFGLSYALAATNGRSAERALNDNDALAGYGRLNFHWADMVRVGGGIMINDRSVGIEPNLFDESLFGWTADLSVDMGWISVFGNVVGIGVSNDIDAEFNSLAYQGALALKDPFFGFQPVFRFAYLDESDTVDGDALTYITFGLNYVPKYPFRVLANYTITTEEEPNELTNNALDILLQVMW